MTKAVNKKDGVQDSDVIIIGAGIGGLSFALALHKEGVRCRIVEAAPEIRPLGVGLNLLPHAMSALNQLGVAEELEKKGVATQEVCFYTHNGQLVNSEPRGRFAGYELPQLSIHRADLHEVLLGAVRERLGPDAVELGHRCTRVEDKGDVVEIHLEDADRKPLASLRGSIAVACDGVRSVVRTHMHPAEAVPRYEGTMQYRGTTRWKPFLTGGSMVYLGTHETGKLVIYPIRNDIDDEGHQLINWVVEISRPSEMLLRDWNRPSSVEEFIDNFKDCAFDWLDVPAIMRSADSIFEYPMVDQDPLPFWSQGRVTLLGDAAHPMMPRGSNGSAHAIIDAITLAGLLADHSDPVAALKEYEEKRLEVTGKVVLANRQISPDAILRVVEERTGGKPFNTIEDVLSKEEFEQWQARYRKVAGFAKEDLRR
ncbi:2-polyprenyl-6-methoxyphenol hydroxylase [Paraburkholderia steynii]|uniref:2-polyprenyl-6-methoxyphenol hydroxylase n=1 Tax=Paraburkholderia steynii TaxID=1245441 RepID=A0A7Z7BBC2_9BURK|nr:flavin-dependent oxidoreductase [Paraburkholderia steynii]SDI55675.1 2-polyprenyl-6-methoxyphenol hydroxylase [Paraburkholderia steynii]